MVHSAIGFDTDLLSFDELEKEVVKLDREIIRDLYDRILSGKSFRSSKDHVEKIVKTLL
ncbi:MAG: hypothetical protein QXX47_01330 [Sulfolobales archaeon]